MSTANDRKISRIYGGFRGVDFRGDECDFAHSPDALNVWKNYKGFGGIETRPDVLMRGSFLDVVYGIYAYGGNLIMHRGNLLVKLNFSTGATVALYNICIREKSVGFVYNGIFYYKDSRHFLQYDGQTVSEVLGFVPTTSIGRTPSGGGTVYQDVNMLSDYRKNTFRGDGTSTEYFLDTADIDNTVPNIVVNGEVSALDYTVDYAAGKITFSSAPPAPDTDGQDNVEITFKKTVDGYKDRILNCKLIQAFDNRVFFSGNADFPNHIWHSALNDPSYFPDLNYYKDGEDDVPIRGMAVGNNVLWVFREPNDSNTTVFYHIPTNDEDRGRLYPSAHSNISTGCIGAAVNFNDDIVFFSDRGMEGISGDITTEQFVAHRSSFVDNKLLAEDKQSYRNMLLAEWEGYLIVAVGSSLYLADSRGIFTHEHHKEYEWFYWELPFAPSYVVSYNGVLYIGTTDKLYTLTDSTAPVTSYWTTPKDRFGYPSRQKTTNKRGCVAEATGDITVSAKTEETEFEEIGTYTDVTDYFVSRIKRKKFKDLQLRFSSNTRFSLEQVTIEAFVGAYIKR